VGHPLYIAQSHGEERLAPLQRLDLALFINREDERFIGRVEIEADDISDLLDEEWIGGELEMLRSVRLYAKEGEVALHSALADAGLPGDASNAPVSGVAGLLSEHSAKHLGNFIFFMSAGSPGPGYIIETREAILPEPIAAVADKREADAHRFGNATVCGTPGGEKNDPGAPDHSGRE